MCIRDSNKAGPSAGQSAFSMRRLLGYAYREALELRRDPIRLAFALLGSVLLMFVQMCIRDRSSTARRH